MPKPTLDKRRGLEGSMQHQLIGCSENQRAAAHELHEPSFYRKQGRLSELEPIVEHGLELQEKFSGENSAQVAETLLTLADIYREEGKKDQSKYTNAVPLYERALKIQVKNAGPDHSKLLSILTGYRAVETPSGLGPFLNRFAGIPLNRGELRGSMITRGEQH